MTPSYTYSAVVSQRFWSKVDIVAPNACWNWKATKHAKGYGHIRVGNMIAKAHRIAYELTNGKIPKGLTIDHLCQNTSCVNPKHLEAVTNRENILRGNNLCARNARMTHCKNGHEFTEKNTRLETTGSRRCRTCLQARERQYAKAHLSV